MLATAARQWWVFVLEGILGIAFGILALLVPGITLLTLAYLFAAWAILSGLASIAEGYRVAEGRGRSWPFAVTGVVSIVAGLLAAILPGPTIGGLILFLAAWLIVGGVLQVWAAYQVRREIDNEWMLALVGALRVILGVAIAAFPLLGAVLAVATIAYAAIMSGAIALALGWRLRGLSSPRAGSAA